MHNALGVIERLSVRRKAQNIMLQIGVINWICNSLKNFGRLEKYTLEYLTALLMNLVLRTEGKKRCEARKTELLTILKELLSNDDMQIRTYVNGTLYSLFASTPIKLEARVALLSERIREWASVNT